MDDDTRRLGNSLDLPLQPATGPLFDPHDAEPAGGVVVMAAGVDVPGVGPKPALVFRFTHPLGEFYPPRVLVLDDDQATKLGPLVTDAVRMAVDAARAARRAPNG